MSDTVVLAEVLARGVAVAPHEAIAIVQTLIGRSPGSGKTPRPPFGPPTLDNVELTRDGLVECAACAVTPVVLEMAALLRHIIPRSATGVPAGLRRALDRGLLEVDEPPFDSVAQFSAVLEPFEQGDRAQVVAALWRRAQPPSEAYIVRTHDRRRGPSRDELRRQLRDADARYYDEVVAPVRRSIRPHVQVPAMALGIAAGLALITAGEVMHAWRVEAPSPAPIAVAVDAARVKAPGDPLDSASTDADRDAVMMPTALSATGGAVPLPRGSAVFDGQLHVVTIADGRSHGAHVQTSPDGRLIAFDSDRDGERAVYVAQRDGTQVRRISGEGYAALPAWAPEGRRLAFVKAEPGHVGVWNLWLASIDSRILQRLTHYTAGRTQMASWFADGRRLCYGHADQLIVLDVATGKTQEYRSPVADAALGPVAVAPDGRKVMFHVARNGAWLLSLHDGSMRRVLADPTATAFAWAPDSRRVAFHSGRNGKWGVWTVTSTAASSEPR